MKAKITFGTMTAISNVPNDDATSTIYRDGEDVGELRRNMADFGASVHMIRVGSYSVEFWDETLSSKGEDFEANGNARAALKAARDYARSVLR